MGSRPSGFHLGSANLRRRSEHSRKVTVLASLPTRMWLWQGLWSLTKVTCLRRIPLPTVTDFSGFWYPSLPSLHLRWYQYQLQLVPAGPPVRHHPSKASLTTVTIVNNPSLKGISVTLWMCSLFLAWTLTNNSKQWETLNFFWGKWNRVQDTDTKNPLR